MSVPEDNNLSVKEYSKIRKYKDIKIEIVKKKKKKKKRK